MSSRFTRLSAVAIATALFLAACGDDDSDTDTTADQTTTSAMPESTTTTADDTDDTDDEMAGEDTGEDTGEDGSVSLTDGAGNTVNVVATDIETSNGVIHVIDAVLLPSA